VRLRVSMRASLAGRDTGGAGGHPSFPLSRPGRRRHAPGPNHSDCFSLCDDPRSTGARVAACAGFTLVELLVVIGLVAALLALLAPALHSARRSAMETEGASNVRTIGAAARMHMDDHARRLPQLRIRNDGTVTDSPEGIHLGWLFGGARSVVNVFGASGVGANRRPLNAYVGEYGADAEVGVFRDPLDAGTTDSQLTGYAPGRPDATVYDLVGTSYALNDHALDRVPCPFVELFNTLIPPGGGPAPAVRSPARTWLVGQSPIYNYDDGLDKGEVWGRDRVRSTLCYVDGHVEVAVPVARGPVNTTDDYTFYPAPGWETRFDHFGAYGATP